MAVDAKAVKELRDVTGASILDCKNALEEHDGDFDAAKEFLAAKGLATAKKKAGRDANEGKVETYTHHGGRVGVMVEVNCETDFVAATDQFQELARDLALHIAFSNPQYLDRDAVPEEDIAALRKEFEDEAREQGKPDNIVEKIAEGRINKALAEVVLMEQPFVKDEDVTIKELLTNAVAELKENIQIARFARFELGVYDDEE